MAYQMTTQAVQHSKAETSGSGTGSTSKVKLSVIETATDGITGPFHQQMPFGYNTYATKKTLAKGLLDIGLLVANASQLKSLLSFGPEQEHFHVNMVLISLSISLQLVTGILLLILGSMEPNGKHLEERRDAHRLNDVTVGFVFVITAINIFIAAFGIRHTEQIPSEAML
ncbi:NINJ1-like protein [Mya arenaria]|uniref:NINJ1-like protein n=1 Tax=Mya arenaria TaxID=6604 RepID=A0ABY7FY78_MYAAR|nr:NINJ1-like protein [Mya arenaria]